MKTVWTLGAVAATIALAGCGSQQPSTAPSTSAPASTAVPSESPAAASSAAASSAPASTPSAGSAPAGTPSAQSTPSSGSQTASVKDPCQVISVKQMSKLSGVTLGKSRGSKLANTRLCVYTPTSFTSKNLASVTTQEGKLGANSLAPVVNEVNKQFKSSAVKDVSVAGADEAKLVTGKTSGVNAVDVIASKDGVFYQSLIAGNGNPKDYEPAAKKIAEALLAG